VVLLDEVEKAHPDVFNMLLQIMEEGRLTDSFGRNVDFRNTILIMTSNIGADLIKGGAGFGFSKRTDASDFENIKSVLMKEIERFFRPEFINRLDDIIVFHPLTKADLFQIIDFEVGKLSKRLASQGMSLDLDQTARDFLIEKGYNPEFGARPLRRAIGQHIEDPLSELLLGGDANGKGKIMVKRKVDSDGKPLDHLYFDMQDKPVEPPPEKPQPAGASST
jgi:ATP-dependent Clp protease ATP-binding subunit ClpC